MQAGYDFERLDISTRVASTVTDLPRLRAGGVGGQFWSLFVPSSLQGDAAVTATLEQIDGVHHMIRSYAADLALARTAADVDVARSQGRIASLLGAVAVVTFYALGLRLLVRAGRVPVVVPAEFTDAITVMTPKDIKRAEKAAAKAAKKSPLSEGQKKLALVLAYGCFALCGVAVLGGILLIVFNH